MVDDVKVDVILSQQNLVDGLEEELEFIDNKITLIDSILDRDSGPLKPGGWIAHRIEFPYELTLCGDKLGVVSSIDELHETMKKYVESQYPQRKHVYKILIGTMPMKYIADLMWHKNIKNA